MDMARLMLTLDVEAVRLSISHAINQRQGPLQEMVDAEVARQLTQMPRLVAEAVEEAMKGALRDALAWQKVKLTQAISETLGRLVSEALQKGTSA